MSQSNQPQSRPIFFVDSPWGTIGVDLTLPGVRKQLMCSQEGCRNTAVKRWCEEGRLSDKQYCNLHYNDKFGNAMLEVARKHRREQIEKEIKTEPVKP